MQPDVFVSEGNPTVPDADSLPGIPPDPIKGAAALLLHLCIKPEDMTLEARRLHIAELVTDITEGEALRTAFKEKGLSLMEGSDTVDNDTTALKAWKILRGDTLPDHEWRKLFTTDHEEEKAA